MVLRGVRGVTGNSRRAAEPEASPESPTGALEAVVRPGKLGGAIEPRAS